MSKLYHVSLHFRDFKSEKDLSTSFDQAENWIRYAPNCWFLKIADDETPQEWRSRLIEASDSAYVFLTRIDPRDFSGYLSAEVWNWLKANGLGVAVKEGPPAPNPTLPKKNLAPKADSQA